MKNHVKIYSMPLMGQTNTNEDTVELGHMLDEGFEIIACTGIGGCIVYTLVKEIKPVKK